MYVNATNLENSSLEDAVQALKGAMLGKVQIGVAKPLPVSMRISILAFFLCLEPVNIKRQIVSCAGVRSTKLVIRTALKICSACQAFVTACM